MDSGLSVYQHFPDTMHTSGKPQPRRTVADYIELVAWELQQDSMDFATHVEQAINHTTNAIAELRREG